MGTHVIKIVDTTELDRLLLDDDGLIRPVPAAELKPFRPKGGESP